MFWICCVDGYISWLIPVDWVQLAEFSAEIVCLILFTIISRTLAWTIDRRQSTSGYYYLNFLKKILANWSFLLLWYFLVSWSITWCCRNKYCKLQNCQNHRGWFFYFGLRMLNSDLRFLNMIIGFLHGWLNNSIWHLCSKLFYFDNLLKDIIIVSETKFLFARKRLTVLN